MSPTTTETGLRETLLAVAAEVCGREIERAGSISLAPPPQADLGDYSTNAALVLSSVAGSPPRELASRLGEELIARLGTQLERYEVAGPGFLNLFLADEWHLAALASVLAAGREYGRGGATHSERIVIEFVSANPTGPMHVGHARNAAYGDALARLLDFHGHRVEREFYVNDAGSQIFKLGESISAVARGGAPPEDGYKGDYVPLLAARLEGADTLEPADLGTAAVGLMVAQMQTTLAAFRVSFDHWFYESSLHEGSPSAVDRALELLEQHGHTYLDEGALWLRSSGYGDDKDRVLVRSSGEHTYFASDVAYHQQKRERGFQRQIDVFGADHHGYIARMKAAYAALGGDPDELEMLIMQLVHLMQGGDRAQMSKRAGEFVTLEDLLEQIGVDAARWFLLSRSHDTTIDLDLDLAREQSNENPVYYVQYAHARISSMLARAGEHRVRQALEGIAAQERAELHASERALVKKLLAFPGEVAEAATRRAPHRIAAYALELAQQFTAFYRDCRVLEASSSQLESQRLALCAATQHTTAAALELLGVSAPLEM